MTLRSTFLGGTTALLMACLVQFAQFGSDARAATEKVVVVPSLVTGTYPKVYPGKKERNKLKAAGIHLEGVAPIAIGIVEPLPTLKPRNQIQAAHLKEVLSVIIDAKTGLYPSARVKVYRFTPVDFEAHPFFFSKERLDAFIEDEACEEFVDITCMLRNLFINQPVQKPSVLSFSWSYCRTEICKQLLRELQAYPRQLYPVVVDLVGARDALRFRSLNLKYPADGTGKSKMSLDDWFGLNTLPPKILKALARRVDTVVAQSDRVRAAHRDYIECTRRMTEAGAFMVVCAGNQGLDQQELRASPGASLSFLAESPYVISVGGYDENDCLSSFSSSGSSKYHPLVLAPGFFLARDGERLTGTSIGAPYVAATIALMLQQNPDLNLQQVSSILKSTARPLKSVSPLLQGAGRVDVCAAVKAAQRARKGPHQSAGA